MSTTEELLIRVRQQAPTDDVGQAWWGWLTTAIEIGWIDESDLVDLITELRAGRDVGIEDLAFELIDGTLRISFRDEDVRTEPAAVVDALAHLLG